VLSLLYSFLPLFETCDIPQEETVTLTDFASLSSKDQRDISPLNILCQKFSPQGRDKIYDSSASNSLIIADSERPLTAA